MMGDGRALGGHGVTAVEQDAQGAGARAEGLAVGLEQAKETIFLRQ